MGGPFSSVHRHKPLFLCLGRPGSPDSAWAMTPDSGSRPHSQNSSRIQRRNRRHAREAIVWLPQSILALPVIFGIR